MDSTLLESLAGNWHYHLSRNGKAACGALRVMGSHAPLGSWGFKPTHMPTSYCKACDGILRGPGSPDLEAGGPVRRDGDERA